MGEFVESALLPYIDEHATVIAAGADDVWAALGDTLDRAFSTRRAAGIARALGCANCGAWGPRPLAEGSAIPGFRVTRVVPERELQLAGRHRFSSYALIFRLDPLDGTTRLRAETRAAFPGVAGGAYRLLVIGTRGHVLVVRRLLAATRRRAERAARSA